MCNQAAFERRARRRLSALLCAAFVVGVASTSLQECQAQCNKIDLSSYHQVDNDCKHTGTDIDKCHKGFRLGVSIGCDFVCDAHIEGSVVPSVMSQPVRAARDASCPSKSEACMTGFDAGVAAYFAQHGGSSFLWTMIKFFLVMAALFNIATHPKVKHQLPDPAQKSLYRIEKAVAPATRQAKRHARTLSHVITQQAERAINAYKASQNKAGANKHGLPGALPPFGSLFLVGDDIVGSNVSTTNDFPAGLADECARAFARAFTANDGTITLMTPNLAGQHASPAAVTCETLVTGGYTKTVCDEACAEFVKLVGRLLSEAGCDTFDVGVYGKLIKCLSMNAGAKLLRQHGLLAHGAISSIAADDADGRDRELAEKHMLQLRHTIAVGVTSGKPAVHIISNAFVGSEEQHGADGFSPCRVKMVSSNLLQATDDGQVCKINFLVKKTGFKSTVEAVSENLSELHAAVSAGKWSAYLSTDSEAGTTQGGV